ncbi:hypothetical protein ACX40Y_18195, partial [Sphingomonas sp. RS6]
QGNLTPVEMAAKSIGKPGRGLTPNPVSSRPSIGINRTVGSTHRWRKVGAQTRSRAACCTFVAPAVELMRRLRDARVSLEGAISANGLVFAGKQNHAISDTTMVKAMRDRGINGVTVHRFRSSFTDWTADQTDFPKK